MEDQGGANHVDEEEDGGNGNNGVKKEGGMQTESEPTDTGSTTGTDGRTPRSISTNHHHPISKTVSFSDEDGGNGYNGAKNEGGKQTESKSTDTESNSGIDDRTSRPISTNYHHSISKTVSFNEEDGGNRDNGTENHSGTKGSTSNLTDRNCNHHICRTVSFNEEDIVTGKSAISKTLALRRSTVKNTSRKTTTLQKRMQQLQLETDGIPREQGPVKPQPQGTQWGGHGASHRNEGGPVTEVHLHLSAEDGDDYLTPPKEGHCRIRQSINLQYTLRRNMTNDG